MKGDIIIWRGYVEIMESGILYVRLDELTHTAIGDDGTYEVAEIPLKSIPEPERGFAEVGATFTLKLSDDGMFMKFFTGGNWPPEDTRKIIRRANKLKKTFNWE